MSLGMWAIRKCNEFSTEIYEEPVFATAANLPTVSPVCGLDLASLDILGSQSKTPGLLCLILCPESPPGVDRFRSLIISN
eukprot:6203785-Pleurochrysis_carterae.AAC.4